MPEGPEVVITTQYLNSKIRNKKIIGIKVLSGRYTHQTLEGLDLIKNNDLPLRIVNVDSKGKFMWIEIQSHNNTFYIMNTFGMSGGWSFHKSNNSRVLFRIIGKNGSQYNLYFNDQRNFGTLKITDDSDVLDTKINTLAPDILKGIKSDDDIVQLIQHANVKKNKNIVQMLMDQKTIVAGIGNYLVAEILYDAKINPHRSIVSLSRREIKKLAHSMRKISKLAYYDNTTGYMENLSGFVEKHKEKVRMNIYPDYHPDIKGETFQFKVYGRDIDDNGNKVKQDEIVKGRTIHWVPSIQK